MEPGALDGPSRPLHIIHNRSYILIGGILSIWLHEHNDSAHWPSPSRQEKVYLACFHGADKYYIWLSRFVDSFS